MRATDLRLLLMEQFGLRSAFLVIAVMPARVDGLELVVIVPAVQRQDRIKDPFFTEFVIRPCHLQELIVSCGFPCRGEQVQQRWQNAQEDDPRGVSFHGDPRVVG